MKREAQATVVANAVAEVDGGRGSHMIVLGDYNTFNENALDANDNHPIDNTARILENAAGALGYKGRKRSKHGVDVVGMVPQSLRYSEWWDRNGDCAYDPMVRQGRASPRPTSPDFTSIHLTSPSPHFTSPHLTSLDPSGRER